MKSVQAKNSLACYLTAQHFSFFTTISALGHPPVRPFLAAPLPTATALPSGTATCQLDLQPAAGAWLLAETHIAQPHNAELHIAQPATYAVLTNAIFNHVA